jgi:hypothetical protein
MEQLFFGFNSTSSSTSGAETILEKYLVKQHLMVDRNDRWNICNVLFSFFSCLFHFHFLPLFIFFLSLSIYFHVIIFLLLLPSTPPMPERGFDTRVFQEQFPLKQQELKALLQLDILVYIIHIHYVTGKYWYFNEYLRIPLLSSLCPHHLLLRPCPRQRALGAKLTMVVLGPLEQEGSIWDVFLVLAHVCISR